MEHYFAVRYGDIVVVLYHEDMRDVRELLFENSRKEKTLKRFLEYCYMIDVKVVYISEELTIPHGQSDHLSRRFRSLISERYSR